MEKASGSGQVTCMNIAMAYEFRYYTIHGKVQCCGNGINGDDVRFD